MRAEQSAQTYGEDEPYRKKMLYVPLSAEAWEMLATRARRELRRPQHEALILIEQGLGLRLRPPCPIDTDVPATPEGAP